MELNNFPKATVRGKAEIQTQCGSRVQLVQLFFFFFGSGTGAWTQDLTLARQML
jgi:hypothetical protein